MAKCQLQVLDVTTDDEINPRMWTASIESKPLTIPVPVMDVHTGRKTVRVRTPNCSGKKKAYLPFFHLLPPPKSRMTQPNRRKPPAFCAFASRTAPAQRHVLRGPALRRHSCYRAPRTGQVGSTQASWPSESKGRISQPPSAVSTPGNADTTKWANRAHRKAPR